MKISFKTLILSLVLISCSKVPLTGRRQLNLLPESQVVAMSLTEYNSFLGENSVVSKADAQAQVVQRVGLRISQAVHQYLQDNNMGDRDRDFQWEFNLVNDNTINAWCMPGGKVVVYTGILPYTRDEEGLAVVMGHEIAHAIARHGNERMSQALAVEAGGVALDLYASQKPELTRQVLLQSYGIGSSLGVLAYSRQHESEADKLGLVFMAMAGYNPQAAPDFWRRMNAASENGNKVPEFLSTHPKNETRIKDLENYMPEALKYYKAR
jgi:predicted Zn-dependent protease